LFVWHCRWFSQDNQTTHKILFIWHCRPTLSAGGKVGREFFFFFFFLHLKALYFQTVFSQEHRGRYDIKESNLMQHKEQQKSNSIFIKKTFSVCLDAFHCRPLRHYFRFSRPFSILCRLSVCSQYSVHQALLWSRFEMNKDRNKLRGHDWNSGAIPFFFNK
jgi:hypothetical protein